MLEITSLRWPMGCKGSASELCTELAVEAIRQRESSIDRSKVKLDEEGL